MRTDLRSLRPNHFLPPCVAEVTLLQVIVVRDHGVKLALQGRFDLGELARRADLARPIADQVCAALIGRSAEEALAALHARGASS